VHPGLDRRRDDVRRGEPRTRRLAVGHVLVAGLAFALALAGARDARADGIGVIAAGGDRAAVAAALVEAIGARERVVGDAVGEARAAVAGGAVPVATLAQFRRVREMIDDGWRAYLRVQIDFAQSRLAAARSAAEPLVALPGGAELYADAALRLGAVLHYRRIADAPAVLALALALDPGRPITLAEFSPDVVDAVAAVRAAPAAMQRVHVATAPAGALVSIDGVELGRAPLDAQVTRGQHLVVVRAPLHRATVQGVVVGEAAARVEVALDPDGDALRLAAGAEPGLAEPAEQGLVDAALRFADLDEVVVAAISDRRGGPTLILQRCAGAPARCTAVVEVGFGDRAGLGAAAREAWQAVRAGEPRYPPGVIGDVQQRPPPQPAGCRLCRNPLLWTGVTAAVLGTVIAIVVTSGSPPPPIVTVDGRDFGR
jgi:PEGA domain